MKKINLIIILSIFILVADFALGYIIKDISTKENINTNINNINVNAGIQTKININVADKNELMSIEGIGDKRADSIINNRPYISIWDLQKAGISEDFIKKNEGRLTI